MNVELKSRLEGKAKCLGHDLTSQEFALAMDAEDPLRSFRNLFHFPKRINIPEGTGDVNCTLIHIEVSLLAAGL